MTLYTGINWNVHVSSESAADSMGDRGADSDQTSTFQCLIITGDLSDIRLAWS